MTIRLLSQNLINQIAAGEVIERPSSVIKELMENAVDAGATEIEVKIINAGKSFISVSDNGCGMEKESIGLCLLNHATSKLSSENLFDIHTFGFRGEALPSISSIARVTITSATTDGEAWTILQEGTQQHGISPSTRNRGTTVEVKDLFFATPARLKFLKSDTSEAEACLNVFNRIALAFKNISFRFLDSDKQKAFYEKTDNLEQRISDVFGKSLIENTFFINSQNATLQLHGFTAVPTFNKASANYQYFFVNNRFVKDKFFASALKSAYSGLVPQGRYAASVLYLDMPFNEVDVNAHPSKTEIRFKDSEKIRYFIMSELKKALSSFGAAKPKNELVENFYSEKAYSSPTSIFMSSAKKTSYFDGIKTFAPKRENNIYQQVPKSIDVEQIQPVSHENISLGNALYQINNMYIVAAVEDNSLIIVDQHAAAERITLEKLKNHLSLDAQSLLLPEICALSENQVELLENNKELLLKFGIYHEKLTNNLVKINAIPAILETCDAKALITDIIDELYTFGETFTINDKINHILSVVSCHGSLRAGKKLSIQEMDSLLRQMENTSNIAQCCHGRPSYVVLSIKDLNKFFDRC